MKNPAVLERGSRPSVATVAEVCEHHIAAQAHPRTTATYRSRLRPLTHRWGDLPAAEALARLNEIEHELEADVDRRAHEAVTLLRAALRDAGFELLTLVAASTVTGIAIPSLRALVDDGKIGCRYRRRHGRGESILFDPVELASDLAALDLCPVDGCARLGTGPSGHCGEHFGEAGRDRARDADEQLLARRRNWRSVSEAVRVHHVAPATIYRAIEAGELPSARVGRHRRIPTAALREWIKTLDPKRSRSAPPPRELREADARQAVILHQQGLLPGQIAKKLHRCPGLRPEPEAPSGQIQSPRRLSLLSRG